jgi:hypothetical protein
MVSLVVLLATHILPDSVVAPVVTFGAPSSALFSASLLGFRGTQRGWTHCDDQTRSW